MPKKFVRWAGIALVNLVLIGILLEVTVGAFFLFPSWIRAVPRGLADTVRQVYEDRVRHVIQLDPQQSVVDPELLYRLKPGTFTFANVEFATAYQVNSLGVRDTEAALRAPEIVVAGDSFAMGWGVEQDATFPRLLERATGLRVLNTGISSYGTARELTLLRRVDTSHMKYLVIQYNANDLPENRAFVQNGDRLKTGDLDVFQRLRDNESRRTRYLPFKYALGFFDASVRRLRQRRQVPPPVAMHADLFLQVLGNPKWGLDAVQVIVFELSERTTDPHGFATALRAAVAKADGPPFVKKLEIVDLSGALTDGMFYDLDGHLRPEGHRAVADVLKQVIEKRK